MTNGDKTMNQPNADDNQTITLEDLDAAQAEDIKGGPTPKSKRIIVLQSSLTAGPEED